MVTTTVCPTGATGAGGTLRPPGPPERRPPHSAGPRAPAAVTRKTTTMQTIDIDPTTAHNLILVDIDDLRAAFGGEAATRDPSELQAVPTSTIMCPQW